MMKFFTAYPYVVFSIIAWAYIFIVIRLKGIKKLYPVGILGALILFGSTYWLISVGLYKINANFLPILGMPFFYFVWGAASGIIFAYYFGDKLIQRLFAVLGFSGLVVFAEYLVESVKAAEHVGRFNNVFEYFFDVMILSTFAFLMTNLFKKRLVQ